MPIIEAVAEVMVANPGLTRVLVEGHTDTVGGRISNLELSRQRAEAVCAALVARGVAARRLQSRGFGPDLPIADNATAAGREANRRVDFVIYERNGR